MKTSVIIPTFNSIAFIGEALESVYKQTFPIDEIICVDDASTDKTVAFINSSYPNVKILTNNENRGPSYCRNLGITVSSGDAIAFLDADDYWELDKTILQLRLFNLFPEMELIGGLGEYFFLSPTIISNKNDILNKPHFNAYLATFIIKKAVFDKIGVFNETMRLSEDQDWFLRAREANVKMKIMNKTVLKIRIHDQNTTNGIDFKGSGIIDALKNSLDRRRQSGNLGNLKFIKPE